LNATRISNGSRWIVSGPVRGQTVVVGLKLQPRREKATEGAEKSFPSRRRKRGLRKGTPRSRAGKARRSEPDRPLISKEVVESRGYKRHLREGAWALSRGDLLITKVVQPLVDKYPDSFGWDAPTFIPRYRRKWDGLISRVKKIKGLPEPTGWKVLIAELRASIRLEKHLSESDEVGFGSPESFFGSQLLLESDGIDDGRRRIAPPQDYRSGCIHNGPHHYCDLCGSCLKKVHSCPGPHVLVLPGSRRRRGGGRIAVDRSLNQGFYIPNY
jgi:hypothetical protein